MYSRAHLSVWPNRSFSLTLSPGLSTPMHARDDDSGDSFEIQPQLQRHTAQDRPPQRRYRKQTRSRLNHSREFIELRTSFDPEPQRVVIQHPHPETTPPTPP